MDIDPQTGIDLDKPYDDPEMTAIREKLLASGKQLHGSRLADGDMRTVAQQAMLARGNTRPGATNAMAEAMTMDPGLWESIVAQQAPRLSQNAPETYQRMIGGDNERTSSLPQAQVRNIPPASAPSGTEGSQGLPPLDVAPNEAAEGTGAQNSTGMGPWGPILAILSTLAAGAGGYLGGRALRGRASVQPVMPNAPRAAVEGDLTAGGPRQMVADDVMNMFAPRDAVDADFAPVTDTQQVQPQAKGKPSKSTFKTNPMKIRAEHDAEVRDIETQAMKGAADKAAKGNGKKPLTDSPAFRENMADEARDRKAAAKDKNTKAKPAAKKSTKGELARALARRGKK